MNLFKFKEPDLKQVMNEVSNSTYSDSYNAKSFFDKLKIRESIGKVLYPAFPIYEMLIDDATLKNC